ncbi:hypothetical protein [Candidatus Spongiihabitans sp.]|uniref:hypothetical protein n=1 Tax=Candidatus Spongiihabitans sp. TaxID=3101308 RepID=UPI003C7A39CF
MKKLDKNTINATITPTFLTILENVMQIQIDFEVFQKLTALRASESVTYNDVIRGVLKLNGSTPKPESHPESTESGGRSWVCKGVIFSHGTEFRAIYKGQQHNGRVENGALVVYGERFTAPSAAAISITGNSVNGWRFWECLMPDTNHWVLIDSLKKKHTY